MNLWRHKVPKILNSAWTSRDVDASAAFVVILKLA